MAETSGQGPHAEEIKEIWKLFRETDKKSRETEEKFQETDRRFKAMERFLSEKYH